MRQSRWPIIAWLLVAALAALVVARGRYTADLSAFLPASPTAAQRLLVSQLKEGPASRLVLAAIEGGDESLRARISTALTARLRKDPGFRSVQNGDAGENPADQAYVFRHRYLLSGRVDGAFFTPEVLHERIADTVDLLGSPVGLMAKDLLTRDPTGETLEIVQTFERANPPATAGGVWASRDGRRALLVVEMVASGSDTDAQQAALGTIRSTFERLAKEAGRVGQTAPTLRMTGSSVFAVNARATIQREAVHLSAISSVVIVLFLLLVYRSPRMLLLGMLPVASGALAGVAAVSLGFGVVHGVTLGFGVTLIGEAVDYSVYLFLQRGTDAGGSSTERWERDFWPTVRLGMFTSIVGFASLLPSSFPGLAQLGCYTIAGLLAAGLVTRFVLPAFVTRPPALTGIESLGRGVLVAIALLRPYRAALWLVPVVAIGAFALRGGHLWNRELAALSPVPAEARAFDATMRSDLGAADAGTLVVVSADSAEGALAGAERVAGVLGTLVVDGAIAGYDSPARYLPSVQTQRARQAALPTTAELATRFAQAIRDLPLRPEHFAGFVEDVATARRDAPLTLADVAGTSMGTAVRALLLQDGPHWSALLPLQATHTAGHVAVIDVERVAAALSGVVVPEGSVLLLDLKRESDALYGGYLAESVRLSLYGLAAMLVLLSVSLRSGGRVLRVVAPLVLAVLAVTAGFALAGHPMTILNLVGLLLTVAIGSNYSLFFDRKVAGGQALEARTVASLVIANLTAVIGFGVLTTSAVPVLSDVGSTVAPGALLALVFSALLAAPAGGEAS
jgi:predicted exporter